MKLSALRISVNLLAAWRAIRRLFRGRRVLRLAVLVAALSLVGCSRYVEVPIPPECPSAKWEAESGSCRATATGRFELPECCGRAERSVCDWLAWACF
jgi:hypothetical protein